MGVIAGIAVGAIYLLIDAIELSNRGDTVYSTFRGFDPDDALFIIGPVAWLGALKGLLIAAVIGAPLFLLIDAVAGPPNASVSWKFYINFGSVRDSSAQ